MTDKELMAAALEAKTHAYAPYSRFDVGAAILAGGKLYTGANVENASYGAAICAERSAILRAAFDGARRLDAVAVASDISPPATPCGMCLQVIAEFAPEPDKLRVVLGNPAGELQVYTLADLSPHGFGPRDLARHG